MLNKELLLGSNELLRRCMDYQIEGFNEYHHLGSSTTSSEITDFVETYYINPTVHTKNHYNLDVTFDITGLIDEVKVTDHGYILLIIGGAKSTWYISDSSGSTWYEFFDYSNPDYFVKLFDDFYYGKFLPYNYELGGVSYLGTGKFRIKNGSVWDSGSQPNPGIQIGGYIRRPSGYTSLGNFVTIQNAWYSTNYPTLREDAGLEIYTN